MQLDKCMALRYQVEFFQGYNGKPSDEGCYIQLRTDVPSYTKKIGKEEFDGSDDFIQALFDVDGVVAVSTTAFRVYIEKSPAFSWDEVINPSIEAIRDATSQTGVEEIAPPQYLENKNSRRVFDGSGSIT